MSTLLTIFPIKRIPFVYLYNGRKELDMWGNDKEEHYFYGYPWRAREVGFVNMSDLIEKSKKDEYEYSRIWFGTVGFMSNSWVNEYSEKNKQRHYRFGTGLYQETKKLFIVDDLFAWAHDSRISSDKVRTAFDIITEIKKSS